jgi:hypothetical protein
LSEVPFSIRPGKVGGWRSVDMMLRQQHEQTQKVILEQIAKRKGKGIPLDNVDDWRGQVGDLLDTFESIKDRDAAITMLEKAHAIANGGLRPLDDYESDPAILGIEVRLRSLSKEAVIEMATDIAAASPAASLAIGEAFLRKCLAGVRGVVLEEGDFAVDDLTPESPSMPLVLALLNEAGLIPAIFNCARAYQALNPFQRRGFGLSAPSTSDRSCAPSAPSPDAPASDARAGNLLPSFEERADSSRTPALDGTCSTTTSSLPLSSFAVTLETPPV